MHNEDADMADARAGLETATTAGTTGAGGSGALGGAAEAIGAIGGAIETIAGAVAGGGGDRRGSRGGGSEASPGVPRQHGVDRAQLPGLCHLWIGE